MDKICFAILAHGHRDCLDDLIGNLRTLSPSADIVVFNGGPDAALTRALDVPVCPYSERLHWGKLPQFNFRTMKWLHDSRAKFDFLVTLDSDMLMIKSGLENHLSSVMARSEYMSINFAETTRDSDWANAQAHHYHWRRIWQPIFETANPYQCFNPGQTFRREYVDKWMVFPKKEELLLRVAKSRLPVLEEMVFPTLAMTLRCNPMIDPSSQIPPARDMDLQVAPIRWSKRHSPMEILRYLSDANAYLLHPIPLDFGAAERRLVRDLAIGKSVSFDAYEREFNDELAVQAANVPTGMSALKHFLRGRLRTVYRSASNLYLRAIPQ